MHCLHRRPPCASSRLQVLHKPRPGMQAIRDVLRSRQVSDSGRVILPNAMPCQCVQLADHAKPLRLFSMLPMDASTPPDPSNFSVLGVSSDPTPSESPVSTEHVLLDRASLAVLADCSFTFESDKDLHLKSVHLTPKQGVSWESLARSIDPGVAGDSQ